MALSKEDKEAMAEYYRGKELYDPSKDPSQETASFEPQKLAKGGYCMAHGGYCGMSHGGEVKNPEKKVGKVMHEFGSGKLKSSSGDKVKDRDQAIAIALSEAGMSNKQMENYAKGGPVKMADGGDVPEDGPIFDFSVPQPAGNNFSVASSTDTAKNDGNMTLPSLMAASQEAPEEETGEESAPTPPAQPIVQQKPILPPPAPISVPPQAPTSTQPTQKMTPDQYDELIKSLKPGLGQRLGQGLASGLGGFADALMQGVARAGPGQFQKNMEQTRQNQRQELINALKEKYESQYKGQELDLSKGRLTEEQRAHQATEAETKRARELTERGQNLAEKRAAETLQYEKGKEARQAGAESAKQNLDAAKQVIEAYEKGGIMGKLGMTAAPSAEEYNAAKNVLKSSGTATGMNMVRIKDSTGKLHDLPAASLARAKQRDPGLQVVQ